MRFLSLVLLSGCALVDANKEPHGGGGGGGALSFSSIKVRGFTGAGSVSMAVAANLDNNLERDFIAIQGANLFSCVNIGNGEFVVELVESGYTLIGVGDLDNDGLDDLIGAGPSMVLDVHLNLGGGTGFERTVLNAPLGTGAAPTKIAVGNFPFIDPGGRSIAMSFGGENTVRVVTGVFSGSPGVTSIDVMSVPFDLIATDVGTETGGVDELIIAGTNLIEAKQDTNMFLAKQHAYAQANLLVAGNFFPGGGGDIAYTRRDQGGQLVVYIPGTPTGLPDESLDPIQVGALTLQDRALAAGDFNGDGKDDVALIDNANESALHLFLSQDDGPPIEAATINIGSSPMISMTVADLNGDGRADILLAPGTSGDGVDLLLSR